jgi:hypothetical protein
VIDVDEMICCMNGMQIMRLIDPEQSDSGYTCKWAIVEKKRPVYGPTYGYGYGYRTCIRIRTISVIIDARVL